MKQIEDLQHKVLSKHKTFAAHFSLFSGTQFGKHCLIYDFYTISIYREIQVFKSGFVSIIRGYQIHFIDFVFMIPLHTSQCPRKTITLLRSIGAIFLFSFNVFYSLFQLAYFKIQRSSLHIIISSQNMPMPSHTLALASPSKAGDLNQGCELG